MKTQTTAWRQRRRPKRRRDLDRQFFGPERGVREVIQCTPVGIAARTVKRRETRSHRSQERTRVGQTVIEALPSVDRMPTANVEAMRRPLSPQDVTSIFLNAAASEQSLLPEIALTITQCANPSLVGKKIPVTNFPFRIGRANAEYIISDDEAISREHLILDYKSGVFTVCDAGSKNGTYVNGRRLQHRQSEPLMFGAVIRLSSITSLTFIPGALEGLPDLTGQIIDNRFLLTKLLHLSAKAAVYAARDQRFPQIWQ